MTDSPRPRAVLTAPNYISPGLAVPRPDGLLLQAHAHDGLQIGNELSTATLQPHGF